jgi:DNA-binding MarR family transcriptional regulator
VSKDRQAGRAAAAGSARGAAGSGRATAGSARAAAGGARAAAGSARAKLFREVGDAFRLSGQTQDAMDAAAAAYLGIHRTDLGLLDALQMSGRLSAGELARRAALSPGAVTAALDRLEEAGYVRRVRDDQDRRRVLVEVTDRAVESAQRVYGPLAARSEELLGSYTDDQLRAMIEVLKKGAEMQLERAATLREELNAEPGAAPRRAAGRSAG